MTIMPILSRFSLFAAALAAIILSAACGPLSRSGSAAPTASYRGTIQPSCAPWDGAALELTLDRVSGRGPDQVRVLLWRGRLPNPAETLVLPSDSNGGGQVLVCSENGRCATVERASLAFESGPDDSIVRGQLQATWPATGSEIQAAFSASWAEGRPALCG
jgi:hypothetical protein